MKQQTAQHVQGPLKVSDVPTDLKHDHVFIRGGDEGRVIAELNRYQGHAFADANARELVHRWNRHAELLEACKRAVELLDTLGFESDHASDVVGQVENYLNTAIAKATQ